MRRPRDLKWKKDLKQYHCGEGWRLSQCTCFINIGSFSKASLDITEEQEWRDCFVKGKNWLRLCIFTFRRYKFQAGVKRGQVEVMLWDVELRSCQVSMLMLQRGMSIRSIDEGRCDSRLAPGTGYGNPRGFRYRCTVVIEDVVAVLEILFNLY